MAVETLQKYRPNFRRVKTLFVTNSNLSVTTSNLFVTSFTPENFSSRIYSRIHIFYCTYIYVLVAILGLSSLLGPSRVMPSSVGHGAATFPTSPTPAKTVDQAQAILTFVNAIADERKPEMLDYLGVSCGLTPQPLRFWKRAGCVPLYVRRTQSELTGEHTCVMVRGLDASSDGELEWLGESPKDFRRCFLSLLLFKFREFGGVMGLSVLEAANAGVKYLDADKTPPLISPELSFLLSPFDLKRLESYAQNALDYHVILDLLPTVAALYFEHRPGDETCLSAIQSSILLGMELQRKSMEEVESELQLPVSQALALFVKLVRKIATKLQDIYKAAIGATLPALSRRAILPTDIERLRDRVCKA
ncbi:tRNA binding domain-containing protein [Amylostereum chailletii]|nr:tRNA binding domain-containing protein [Amylostereum chailletii]